MDLLLAGGDWTFYTYDAAGRIQQALSGWGNQVSTNDTNLCRYASFDYDALKRRTGEWRNASGRLTAYDASGRPTAVTRQGTNGSTIALSRTVYDEAGRVRFETNALG